MIQQWKTCKILRIYFKLNLESVEKQEIRSRIMSRSQIIPIVFDATDSYHLNVAYKHPPG